MRHVPPPIAELTAHAQTLTSAGDLVGARNVLAHALDPSDTDPQHASPDLATAAALHARVLIALGDPHGARTWAGFAHAAEARLHGPHDERTVAAAATHAAVLARIGNHGRAAQLYHDLVGALTVLDGPDSPRVLAAEADLATAEHAAGQCTAARARLGEAWARHRRVYGDAAPAGIKMLARLGAMERECGRVSDSRHHLTLAQELCARHLPADHPLVAQVAALGQAPASGRHTCGRVRRSDGPQTAPGVTPVNRPPGVHPVPTYRPGPAPQSPPAPAPDDRGTDPAAAPHEQPLYPSRADRQPGDPTGPHTRADAPPTAPGHPDTAPAGDDGRVDHRLLPVPLDRPAPASSRRPFLLAAALVAGIGVAAAVVAAALPRGEDEPAARAPAPAASAPAASAPPPSAPAPAASTVPPAADGTPAGVRLRDNRDSVTLTWSYPDASEGPVLISGGREGQPQRAFQQLPAGSSDYVVYGLNEQLDYCFTVAVVHSTERVATSPPVCTARG
jgi:hypothetical protein